jgi:uncharacterized membrane protein YhhN
MLWILFIAMGVAHLICIQLSLAPADFITKALLVPIAAVALYQDTKAKPEFVRPVIIGLSFGWIGDVLLHFQGFAYFIGGLSAFLLGHLCYIYAFGKEVSQSKKVHFVMEKPYLILPYIVFFIYIIYRVNPALDTALKAPVFLYCLVILIMSLMAANRYHPAGKASWNIVLLGSLLFVASDYVLAINKFAGTIPHARLIIMSTYIAGQGLIAYGFASRYKPGKLVFTPQ